MQSLINGSAAEGLTKRWSGRSDKSWVVATLTYATHVGRYATTFTTKIKLHSFEIVES
jgi:hypothetical protein